MLFLATHSHASDPARADQPVAERFAARQENAGVKLGGFTLYPELNLELAKDDNIFSDDENRESDLVSRYAGSALLRSNWSAHAFSAGIRYDAERFSDNSNENSDDYEANVDGRMDLGTRTNASAQLRHGRETLSRDSVESRNGLDRLKYDNTSLRLGLNRRYGKITAGAYGTAERQDFDDSTINTAITNRRDNRSKGLGVRVGVGEASHRQYYIDVSHRDTDYSGTSDGSDFDRSSETDTVMLGSQFRLSGTLSGYAQIGYLSKAYEEPLLNDQSGLVTDLGLIWSMTPLTTVTGAARRGFESTTLNDSSGYQDSELSLIIDHELLRRLKLSAGLYYRHEDYELIDRKESDFDYELSAQYQMRRNLTLSLFHRSEQRDSTGADAGREYDGSLFGLGVTLKR